MFKAEPRTSYETDVLSVDFTARIPNGVTISSSTVVAEVDVDSVIIDPNPAATLIGSPQMQGNILVQEVGGGISRVAYVYRFRLLLSNGEKPEEDIKQVAAFYV